MDQILQTIDVATRLGCSVELVRAMARSGRLPSERTPHGTRLYKASDVERVAAERKQQRRRIADSKVELQQISAQEKSPGEKSM